MFNIKAIELVNAEGKRNVKVCNHVRTSMFDKIAEILTNEGFEVVKAANGELAIKTAVDAASGEVYYTRLAVSLSNKPLDSKIVKKQKEKVEVEVPNLFDE